MLWPELPLNDCSLYIQRGKSPKYSDSGKVKIINQKCIRWTAFELEWSKNWDDAAIGSLAHIRYLVAGDILVNSTGEGTIGRANVWESPESNWVVDSHVTIVRPNPSILDSWWLKYWLESPTGQEFVLQSKVGGTKQTELGSKKIEAAKIPIPPLAEQHRIVARVKKCMERVEKIESLQHSVHDEASLLPTAFRYDLWNECAKSAKMVDLSSVADSTKNGLYKPKKFHGQGVILLRMFNINGASLNLDRIERLEVSKKEALDYRVSNGDIIVSRVNSRELVGKSALVEGLQEEAVHEAMIIRLRVCDTQVDKRFLVWIINSPQFLYDLRGRAKHAIGQSSINQKDLLSSRIPLPSIEEQRIKVESMSDLPSLVADLVTECSERHSISVGLRESILRKAFAGEL